MSPSMAPKDQTYGNTENQSSSLSHTIQSANRDERYEESERENDNNMPGSYEIAKRTPSSKQTPDNGETERKKRQVRKRPLTERIKESVGSVVDSVLRRKPIETEELHHDVTRPEGPSVSEDDVPVGQQRENNANGSQIREPIRKTHPRQKHKTHATSDTSESESESENPSKKHRNAVPINVVRFANFSALNFQHQNETRPDDPVDASSSDELAHFDPNPRRPGGSNVGAADVLLQLCSETIDNMLDELVPNDETLDSQQQRQIRASIVRKRKMLQAFQSSIYSQLFSLQDASDTNAVLSRRLRLAKKETGALRARLIELRREKDQTDIMADQVRSGFLKDEERVKGWMEVNRATEGLELAMQREKNNRGNDEDEVDPVVGLEFLLKSVAEDVSSAAPSSRGKGLLTTVKDFNAQLERTLAELEENQ